MKKLWLTTLIFLVAASLFLSLRSRDMFTVDGAFRCLEIQHRQTLFFHESNHLLYPVNVLLWNRAAQFAGARAEGPQEFFSISAAMNAFAAAGCLVILFLLSLDASASLGLSLGVVLAFAFTRAFLLHATSSAEPMVGVFWSFLALAAAALAVNHRSRWPIATSAALFGLALATYQSTIFLAPAALTLLLYGRAQSQSTHLLCRQRIQDLLLFTLSGAAATFLIFGWAYHQLGLRSISQMLQRFFVPCTANAYLGTGIGKWLNLPIGLIRNLFPVLLYYRGLRGFLAGPKLRVLLIAMLILAIVSLLFFSVQRIRRAWPSLRPSFKVAVLTAFVGLLSTMTPLLLWDMQYDKLWLQPLACFIFLVGVSLLPLWRASPRGAFASLAIFLSALLGLTLNLREIVANHNARPADLEQVRQLAKWIGPNDLLIGDWDRISTMYGYGWAKDGQFLSFPTEAVDHGPGAELRVREAIEKRQTAGGRIYFLQILDDPRDSWDSFLGSRCNVPFTAFDAYRAGSLPRATFATVSGPIILRELLIGQNSPSLPAQIPGQSLTLVRDRPQR